MIDRDWLHDFAMACRLTTLHEFTTINTCILTTRLGMDVLTHYGVPARAQAVRAVAYNQEGFGLRMNDVPHTQWPDTAWSVGIEGTGVSTRDTRSWDGHLVVVVRNPNSKRTLIDLTADQMNRPARNINISGPVFMDLTPIWAPGDMLYTHQGEPPNATILGYEPQANAGAWRNAPDWQTHQDLNDLVIKMLDEKYPNGPQGQSEEDA